MPSPSPASYARKVAKGIWWLATPWRMPKRIQLLRARTVKEACIAELAELAVIERERVQARAPRAEVGAFESLDLFNDEDAVQACGLPWVAIAWTPVAADQVVDPAAAARFCIDLWRRREDIRSRFPTALSDGSKGGFAAWIGAEGAAELGLGNAAVTHLRAALDAGLASRARQAFLANESVMAALPHGLTPPGMRELFRSFMRFLAAEANLRPEEVWWLFLEAAQQPARELTLAYAFAPPWQRLHPDGLSIFGRDDFARWFGSSYGAAGPWLDPSRWPDQKLPAVQIRTSYVARSDWRAAHPHAFANAHTAAALLAWLASPEGPVSDRARDWLRGLDRERTCAELAKPGANVIGHFCYPSGLRVSVEAMVQAMRLAGVSTSLRDVLTDAKDDPCHVQFRGMECHDVTIIHTQPEPFFDTAYARAHLYERRPRPYRVAYWYWEFDTIPEAWLAHARQVDEVWAATEFVASGLRKRLDVPVRTLFPGVKLAPFEVRDRAHFGLSERSFTFLFTFHMVSVMERKNPLGLIRAFKSAFGAGDTARLVLKTSFGDRHPQQFDELCAAAADANITVIDAVYSPDEVLSLMNACDAYVSLHRSEGLGLTMAEAMLMGKPVIATGFSGNVDFMDDSNSLLVPYELVKLGKPIPPYDADLEWAEPSVEHAGKLMRRLYEDQAWAREIGAKGKASAETNLSLKAAGLRIAGRLAEIKAKVSGLG